MSQSFVSSLGGSIATIGSGWTNPTNLLTISGTGSLQLSSAERGFTMTQFNFSDLPSDAVITGIEVLLRRNADNTLAREFSTRLVKAGVAVGDNKAATGVAIPTTATTRTWGNPTDLWGTTWTRAEVTASNFGVRITHTRTTGSSNLTQYWVQINVYFTSDQSDEVGQNWVSGNITKSDALVLDEEAANIHGHVAERVDATHTAVTWTHDFFTDGHLKYALIDQGVNTTATPTLVLSGEVQYTDLFPAHGYGWGFSSASNSRAGPGRGLINLTANSSQTSLLVNFGGSPITVGSPLTPLEIDGGRHAWGTFPMESHPMTDGQSLVLYTAGITAGGSPYDSDTAGGIWSSRAQVLQGIAMAYAATPFVERYYRENDAFPNTNAEARLNAAATINSDFVTSVQVGAGGTITATFGNDADAAIQGLTIRLTPSQLFSPIQFSYVLDSIDLPLQYQPNIDFGSPITYDLPTDVNVGLITHDGTTYTLDQTLTAAQNVLPMWLPPSIFAKFKDGVGSPTEPLRFPRDVFDLDRIDANAALLTVGSQNFNPFATSNEVSWYLVRIDGPTMRVAQQGSFAAQGTGTGQGIQYLSYNAGIHRLGYVNQNADTGEHNVVLFEVDTTGSPSYVVGVAENILNPNGGRRPAGSGIVGTNDDYVLYLNGATEPQIDIYYLGSPTAEYDTVGIMPSGATLDFDTTWDMVSAGSNAMLVVGDYGSPSGIKVWTVVNGSELIKGALQSVTVTPQEWSSDDTFGAIDVQTVNLTTFDTTSPFFLEVGSPITTINIQTQENKLNESVNQGSPITAVTIETFELLGFEPVTVPVNNTPVVSVTPVFPIELNQSTIVFTGSPQTTVTVITNNANAKNDDILGVGSPITTVINTPRNVNLTEPSTVTVGSPITTVNLTTFGATPTDDILIDTQTVTVTTQESQLNVGITLDLQTVNVSTLNLQRDFIQTGPIQNVTVTANDVVVTEDLDVERMNLALVTVSGQLALTLGLQSDNTGCVGGGTVAQSGTGCDGQSWLTLSNVLTDNSSSAGYILTNCSTGQQTKSIVLDNFGFSLPDNVNRITGIEFSVKDWSTGEAVASPQIQPGTRVSFSSARLRKAEATVGNDFGDGRLLDATSPSFRPTTTYGSDSDLFGTTWTKADIENAGFGVQWRYRLEDSTGLEVVRVAYACITVYYDFGPEHVTGSTSSVVVATQNPNAKADDNLNVGSPVTTVNIETLQPEFGVVFGDLQTILVNTFAANLKEDYNQTVGSPVSKVTIDPQDGTLNEAFDLLVGSPITEIDVLPQTSTENEGFVLGVGSPITAVSIVPLEQFINLNLLQDTATVTIETLPAADVIQTIGAQVTVTTLDPLVAPDLIFMDLASVVVSTLNASDVVQVNTQTVDVTALDAAFNEEFRIFTDLQTVVVTTQDARIVVQLPIDQASVLISTLNAVINESTILPFDAATVLIDTLPAAEVIQTIGANVLVVPQEAELDFALAVALQQVDVTPQDSNLNEAFDLVVGSPITTVLVTTEDAVLNEEDRTFTDLQNVTVSTLNNFVTNATLVNNTLSIEVTPFGGIDIEEEFIIFANLGEVVVSSQDITPVVSIAVDDATITITGNNATPDFNAYLYEVTSSVRLPVRVAENEVDIRFVEDDPVDLVLIELEEDV